MYPHAPTESTLALKHITPTASIFSPFWSRFHHAIRGFLTCSYDSSSCFFMLGEFLQVRRPPEPSVHCLRRRSTNSQFHECKASGSLPIFRAACFSRRWMRRPVSAGLTLSRARARRGMHVPAKAPYAGTPQWFRRPRADATLVPTLQFLYMSMVLPWGKTSIEPGGGGRAARIAYSIASHARGRAGGSACGHACGLPFR